MILQPITWTCSWFLLFIYSSSIKCTERSLKKEYNQFIRNKKSPVGKRNFIKSESQAFGTPYSITPETPDISYSSSFQCFFICRAPESSRKQAILIEWSEAFWQWVSTSWPLGYLARMSFVYSKDFQISANYSLETTFLKEESCSMSGHHLSKTSL